MNWHLAFTILHVGAGGAALILGTLAVLFRRNTPTHKPLGKFYLWCMVVSITLSFPVSVINENWFLLMVGIFTLHSALTGYRSLILKQLHIKPQVHLMDWIIEGVTGITCLGLVGFGIYALVKGSSFGTIALIFGIIGLRLVLNNVARYRGKVKFKRYALLYHVTAMLASYAGAWTAFLANNAYKWGVPNLVAWLAPTVIITILIISESKPLKQMGKLNQPETSK